ncbi:uncharacterized protein LOC117233807 [Bombus vosnesenskii]|uniref:Uncharacterized protein LOC117233807 n=1 Tax=Bombus vosnesenskii TaxID=207650 RepID=A0A6J3KE71_9HYME|nr:uncharacterized protein LOC117233807 [Bombus vosnesenskii]
MKGHQLKPSRIIDARFANQYHNVIFFVSQIMFKILKGGRSPRPRYERNINERKSLRYYASLASTVCIRLIIHKLTGRVSIFIAVARLHSEIETKPSATVHEAQVSFSNRSRNILLHIRLS